MLETLIKQTPLLQPTDAVKLAYQRAFGIGHLIPSAEAAERRISDELAQTAPTPSAEAFAPIGRGLCRVNLASPIVRGIAPGLLARAMLLTERHFKPSQAAFDEDIGTIEALAEQGKTPFSAEAFRDYLQGYRAIGCPPASHSEEYRAVYRPAYRVVLSGIGLLLPVIAEAERRLGADGHALIAIDGDCGGGKTTLAEILSELFDAPVLHVDDYFLPFDKRTPERAQKAGWCVDWERFHDEVLGGLIRGGRFEYRRFDCATGGYVPREYAPARAAVIEGSYSHHPEFDAAYSKLDPIKVFVSVDPDEQLARLKARDPERLPRFQSEWIPLEKSYHKAYDIKRRADIALESLPWEARI